MRKRAAIVAASVALLGGGTFVSEACLCLTPGPQPSSPGGGSDAVANLWVDDDGGTCTDNASEVEYSDAAACSSFDAANDTCDNGDTVLVKAGTYDNQGITGNNSRTTVCVIEAATGETVTVTSDFSVEGSFVEVADVTMEDGFSIAPYATAHDIIFRDVSATHGYIVADNVQLIGGEIGPNNNCSTGQEDGLQIWTEDSDTATDVVIDGVTIHDIEDNGNQCSGFPNSGVHTDCIQMFGGEDITVRNSTFYDCATSGIIARPPNSSFTLTNILIVNNMFGSVVTAGATINIGNSADRCVNVDVLFNTSTSAWPSIVCGLSGSSGNSVIGNVFDGFSSCGTNFSCSYNITTSTNAIGTGSVRCTPNFDPDSSSVADHHLDAADTCAEELVPSPLCGTTVTTDFDGQARPQPGATDCDAGADERS